MATNVHVSENVIDAACDARGGRESRHLALRQHRDRAGDCVSLRRLGPVCPGSCEGGDAGPHGRGGPRPEGVSQ